MTLQLGPQRLHVYARALGVGMVLCVLWLTAIPAAQAQQPSTMAEPRLVITPSLGWRAGGRFDSPGNNRRQNIDDASSFALALNLQQARGRYYELLYSRQQSRFTRADGLLQDLDVEILHVGGMLIWQQPPYRLESFVTGALGATRLAPGGPAGSSTRPSISLGVGVRVPFTRHVGLRLETRGYLTLTDGDEEIFCVSAPPVGAGCAARYSGNSLLQFEALAGISIAF